MTVAASAAIPTAGAIVGCRAAAVIMLVVSMFMLSFILRAIALLHLIVPVHIISRVRASLSGVLGVFSWWMLVPAAAIAFTGRVGDSCLWLCMADAFLVVAVAFVMLMVHNIKSPLHVLSPFLKLKLHANRPGHKNCCAQRGGILQPGHF